MIANHGYNDISGIVASRRKIASTAARREHTMPFNSSPFPWFHGSRDVPSGAVALTVQAGKEAFLPIVLGNASWL